MLRIFMSLAMPCAVAGSVFAFGGLAPARATPLNIGSSVSINTDLRVNGGIVSDDITPTLSVLTALTGGVDSAVDDGSAVNAADSFSQVGNPFTDPPTPFIATAFDETVQPDGDQARGFYYIESTITPDDNQKPAVLDRTLTSTAELDFADVDTDASAASSFELGRDLVLTNTSDMTAYAFSISTGFDYDLAASADALGSQSIAEAVFTLSFITSGTVFLSDPAALLQSNTIDDSDPGVSATQNLVTSNALFDGVHYRASVSATGTGAPTEASLSAVGQFLFSVMMAPGSSLRLSFFQSENTMTSYVEPPVSEVPLPASALLFLGGLGVFAGAKKRRGRPVL
jgi:hypothetical protein